MKGSKKTEQLQIRLSKVEKDQIRMIAKQANMGMSEFIVSEILSKYKNPFSQILIQLQIKGKESYALAELNDFLEKISPNEFEKFLEILPKNNLDIFYLNYVCTMIEFAAYKKKLTPPAWIKDIQPLKNPFFASDLKSIRLHLLLHTPAPFKRRNIFIDSSLGDRV